MHFKKILKIFFTSAVLAALYNKTVAILSDYHLLKTENGYDFLWNYGRVWYEKKGCGSPVVLLHELNACASGYEWSALTDRLSENHTVYIPDLPGCGRSDKPNLSYSNFLYVKFLMQFLEEAVGEPATIITGGDSSSFALLSTALDHRFVKKIICINPSAAQGQTQALSLYGKILQRILSLPVIGTLFYNHCVSLEKIEERFINEYFYGDADVSDLVSVYHESAHKSLCYARKMYAAELFSHCILPVKHLLPNLSIPVDIIFGTEEADATTKADAYLCGNDAIHVTYILDTAHLPQLEAPETLYESLSID